MRLFIFIIFVFSICQSQAPCVAATAQEPAYRKAELRANFPWTEGLSIDLSPDVEQCKARYGRQWKARCAAVFGRPGDTAKNVKMTPEARGNWRWADGSRLNFYPSDGASLKPDTVYTVDLTGFYFPPSVKLAKKRLTTRTPSLSVLLKSAKFWIDPSPEGQHRLAASLQFNYPVPKNHAAVEVLPGEAVFGKAEEVWNSTRDALNISWIVKGLPATDSTARIFCPGFGQLAFSEGRLTHTPAGGEPAGTLFSQNIPGLNRLFGISEIKVRSALDEGLNQIHLLDVETSLYARPDDVHKNITVWQLPEFNNTEAVEPYNWASSPGISAEALKRGRKLAIAPCQAGGPPGTRFTFRLPVESGRYVFAVVNGDLASASGLKLGRSLYQVMKAESAAPRVGFMQPGNILPLGTGGLVDINATAVDRIEWEASKIREPFLALLAYGSGNAFAYPMEESALGLEAISDSARGSISVANPGDGAASFATLDAGAILASVTGGEKGQKRPSGLLNIQLTGYAKGEAKAWSSRLILATNLGLLVKKGASGALDCFTQYLDSGKPAQAATVHILGANGKPVLSGSTDNLGHTAFPPLTGLARDATPVAIVAELDGNLAWLSLKDKSRSVDYADFATGGAHVSPTGLNVYAFGQRGIYRPGETMNFGCLARMGDFSQLPAELPLYAEIQDPRGNKIWEKVFQSGQYGLSTLTWPVPADAMSGRYILNIRTARDHDILSSVAARVEEFQPETLKLGLTPPRIAGWLNTSAPGDIASVRAMLQNLYGAPAAGHKISATFETLPAQFKFDGFPEFIFTDAAPFIGEGVNIVAAPALTDANGGATIPIPSDLLGASSARITVTAEGFEADGGRATTGQTSFLVSPMSRILGYRPLGALTSLSFINQGQKAELEFIALDPALRVSAWPDLKFSISGRKYVKSLQADGNGGYRYDDTPVDMPFKAWNQGITASPLKVPLETGEPGEFILVVRDQSDNLVAQIPYVVAGERIAEPDSPLAPSRMRARLNASAYAPGDTIEVALSLPYDGSGLLAIERDGVEAFAWFAAKAGDSIQRITIPESFEGKGYVTVSFVRSSGSPAIYMSPHSWFALPFTSNMAGRDLGLALNVAPKNLPGQPLRIKLTAREKGKAVLFVVDEGVLQLTNYRAPDPLKALLGDRALDVRTLQAYDLLMPDHARLARRLAAFGGGMDGAPLGVRFNNPFKRRDEPPLAAWSGLLTVGPEPVEVEIPVPDYYNGSARLIAVGASAHNTGVAAMSTRIAAPLILTPQTPLAVSPGDIFDGAIILANTTDREMAVRLAMTGNPAFESLLDLPASVVVGPKSETSVPCRFKALDCPGAQSLEFKAASGSNQAARKAMLSIRPASPLRTSLVGGRGNGTVSITSQRRIYAEQAKNLAFVSPLPLPLARGFAQYLDTYPFGCTEQLISKAYSALMLRGWPGLANDPAAFEKLLSSAVTAIRARFTGEGVGLWPDSPADPGLTAYAVDFLLAMREAGFNTDETLLRQLCDCLADTCALNESSLDVARNCAYAIWVLTREGRITTRLIENLLAEMEQRGIPGWQQDVTAALLAASQLEMHVSRPLSFESVSYAPAGWFDEYGQQALHILLLARYFPAALDDSAKNAFFDASEMAMRQGQYATFSASLGIRGLLALAAAQRPELMEARVYCEDRPGEGTGIMAANGLMLDYEIPLCQKFVFETGNSGGQLFWQLATTGYDRGAPMEPAVNGIEISREYRDLSGQPLREFQQGKEVVVVITARAMLNELKDCVITDLLPGGFELLAGKEAATSAPLPQGVKFVDRQGDRVLIFADLGGEALEFSYRARPVSAGSFIAPPVYAEAMYDSGRNGHGAAMKVEVKK